MTYYDPDKFTLLMLVDDKVGDKLHVVEVPIHQPIAAVRGHYEVLDDAELEDLQADLAAEAARRDACTD